MLRLFASSTEMMSADTYPTLSSYIPLISFLREMCETFENKYRNDEDEDENNKTLNVNSKAISAFVISLNENFKERFEFVNFENEPLLFSMLIDPRYKMEIIECKKETSVATIKLKYKTILLWKKYIQEHDSSSEATDNEEKSQESQEGKMCSTLFVKLYPFKMVSVISIVDQAGHLVVLIKL